ncbi:MAG: YoaK family protein [Polaromonas sp.]
MHPLIHGWTDINNRTVQTNTRLGAVLAFVAGATNAGGFLAVGTYTSHMTGVVSSMADNLVLGELALVAASLGALAAFLFGAMTTAWLVNWGLREKLASSYGLPLLLESALLLIFGIFGAAISVWSHFFVPLTVLLLCFIMGLQNAVITKISKAEIRTTHLTGLVTDLGIELGKLLYINRSQLSPTEPVRANRVKLRLHLILISSFFVGALVGALGFKHVGYVTTVPLALALLLLIMRPIAHDVQTHLPHLR